MAVAVGAAIAYYAWGNPIYFVLGLIAGYYVKEVYLYMGIVIGLVFGHEPFLLLLSLMFILGIPHGTLVFKEKRKDLFKFIFINIFLFLVPFLVFVNLDYPEVLLFCSGALVVQWFVK